MIHLIAYLFAVSGDVEDGLLKGRPTSSIPMQEYLQEKGHRVHFTSSVALVEMESGIKGVLKEDDLEWPRSTVAEVAAYRASKFLGLHLVPPTVYYSNENFVGSLQYYVEPSFDLAAKGKYEEALQRVPPEEWAAIQLFAFVFGQWDSGSSNFIPIEKDGVCHFALIDNAAIGFSQKTLYGDYSFVKIFPDVAWPIEADEGAFPYATAKTLPPDPALCLETFGNTLSDTQINTLCRLRQPIHYIIWQGSFWRQYRFGTPCFTTLSPEPFMTALKNLTEANLRDFFRNPFGVTFPPSFYHDILNRRNQLINPIKEK